jgi:hypothetical protein
VNPASQLPQFGLRLTERGNSAFQQLEGRLVRQSATQELEIDRHRDEALLCAIV